MNRNKIVYSSAEPEELLEHIRTFESSAVHITAFTWLLGKDIRNLWPTTTLKKHSRILKKYDLDISEPPIECWRPISATGSKAKSIEK